MSWGTFDIQGVTYDLTHLDSFHMVVSPKDPNAPTYNVLVSFGCHTFTETWGAADPAHLKFVNGGEERRFCTVRHGHSLGLPKIVKGANKVYFTGQQNYLIAENLPGLAGPYAVFFKMTKAKAKGIDAAMFIVSAYEKPALPPKNSLLPITMPTLVGKTVRGEQIKPPPKRK